MSTDGTSAAATERDGKRPAPGVRAEPGGDIVRVLSPDGHIVGEARNAQLGDEQVRALYRAMVRTRVFDDAAQQLERARRIGFHSGSWGAEATVVGSVFALRAQDWVFPSHRDLGGALLRGMSAQQYADHLFGNVDGVTQGRQPPDQFSFRAAGFASVGSPSGAQLTHAVGFAWAARLRGEPMAVLVSFGDVTTDGGGFHDAMNFAGVFKTATVFLCRNTSGVPLHDKGIAYAIDSVRCDGNDVLAVIEVTRTAAAKALAGNGATLIEAVTSLTGPGAEDELDPVDRMRRHLALRTGWSDADDADLWKALQEEANDAFAQAAVKSAPTIGSLFEDVYKTPGAELLAQRAELERGPRYPGRETD